jgi:hypothetical protein
VCSGSCALFAIALDANARERFEVPEGCGSESAFESEFERLTGTPAPDDVPASLVIEALGARGYELRLLVRNEQRVLRDPDCRTLWRSAIVISAAAIGLEPPLTDPASPALTVPESPPSGAEPPAASPAPGVAAPAPAPSPRARRTRRPSLGRTRANRRPRPPAPTSATSQHSLAPSPTPAPSREPGGVRYGVELGAGVSGGVLPGVGAALELGARIEAWPGAVLLGLRYWPERSVSRDGRGVDVSAVGVRAAAAFWAARKLQVLAGLELNRLAGVGLEGVSGRSSDAAWQLAPTLGLSLILWDNQYLRIELGGAGRASLIRPAFVVTGYGEVYQVPVFGADAIIRGVWLFP